MQEDSCCNGDITLAVPTLYFSHPFSRFGTLPLPGDFFCSDAAFKRDNLPNIWSQVIGERRSHAKRSFAIPGSTGDWPLISDTAPRRHHRPLDPPGRSFGQYRELPDYTGWSHLRLL